MTEPPDAIRCQCNALRSAFTEDDERSIRTFLEHRAIGPFEKRSVIIERGGLLGFLFLNNHLHALHHAKPDVPWYRLPALYRQERDRILRRNGGYAYPDYAAVIRRYLLAPKEPAVYPAALLEPSSPRSG